MDNKTCDPVMDWLNRHQATDCQLEHEVNFDLDQSPLIVRSNAIDLINKVRESFCCYPSSTAPMDHASSVVIEVYYIGSRAGTDGIAPISFLGAGEAPTHVGSSQTRISGDGYIHMKERDIECFWRPNNMMISFPSKINQPIRILVCDDVKKDGNKGQQRFRIKGRVLKPENVSEIVDLIKIIYIRSQGQFCVHGATVAIGDRGALITGRSGQGKTTTALAAVRDGFDLLSDELTIVNITSDQSVQLQGLLIPPAIVGTAPQGLENLESVLDAPKAKGKSPLLLNPSVIQSSRHRSAILKVILFLDQADDPDSPHTLTPISFQEALTKLMEQVLDFDCSFRRKARFEAMVSLASSCPAYCLTLGRDLKSIPQVIRSCIFKEAQC